MNEKRLKIAIVKTGALGGFYGMLLMKSGQDVHFLLRSDYTYVKEHGLELRSSILGDILLPKVNAYKDSKDMPIADIVLVCLKTTQNDTVLPKVLPDITDGNSIVILIQNGLGMESNLASQLPNIQIAGAVALIGAHKEENGVIVHGSYGSIDLGNYNVKDNQRLEQLKSVLDAANIPTAIQDLATIRWKKLVWNTTFNGMSVVLDLTTDSIIADYPTQYNAIMHEVIGAANACGVQIPLSYIDGLITFTHKMGHYAPSMKYDYDRGQPLELEYLYQKPIEEAEKAGFDMKETRKLYNQLLEINNR